MAIGRNGLKYKTAYLQGLFDYPALTINRIVRLIRKEFSNCHGIVVSDGISGVSLVVPIALKLKLPFAIARDKDSHSNRKVEGYSAVKNYVFVDDYIATGVTLERTCRSIYEWNKSKPIGAILYQSVGGSKMTIETDSHFFKKKIARTSELKVLRMYNDF